jgi:hypothetical protein
LPDLLDVVALRSTSPTLPTNLILHPTQSGHWLLPQVTAILFALIICSTMKEVGGQFLPHSADMRQGGHV